MVDPVFWLGLSILLVAVSLTALLTAALPALRELGRAARSAEKLFDTLNRELPPTLESIRLTGLEITNLTDDVGDGVQSAGRVVQQIDQSITGLKTQAKNAQMSTRNLLVGFKAAWKSFRRPSNPPRRSPERLPPGNSNTLDLEEGYLDGNSTSPPITEPFPDEVPPPASEFEHHGVPPHDGYPLNPPDLPPVEIPPAPRKQSPVVYSDYDDDSNLY